MSRCLACVALVVFAVVSGACGEYLRVCYYTNWAQYRPQPMKFVPENIDPFLCTHINYAFAKVVGNNLKPYEWNDESTPWMKGMYERVISLKNTNPKLKVLLAVGGWTHGSAPFTNMVKTQQNILEFAENSIKYLREQGFDGLDLDWEYPTKRGSPPEDRQRFIELLRILLAAFDKEARSTGNERLLLTAAVGAGRDKIDDGYDVPAIAKYLDFINVMTYDLHGAWEKFTGINSPLFSRLGETAEEAQLNQNWAMDYWMQNGAPRNKLVMGMGTYGRSFTLQDKSQNSIGAPALRGGAKGKYTREDGILASYEICERLKQGWTPEWSNEQKVPYAFHDNQWVGYDDLESFDIKLRYIKEKQFAGAMIWSLPLADFTGSCGYGKNPLLKKMKEMLSNPSDGIVGGVDPLPPLTTRERATTTTRRTQPPVTTRNSWTRPRTSNPPRTWWPPRTTTLTPRTWWPPRTTTLTPRTWWTPRRTTRQAPTTTTKAPPSWGDFDKVQCRVPGIHPIEKDCQGYIMCVPPTGYIRRCQSNLRFNPDKIQCDWSNNVECPRP